MASTFYLYYPSSPPLQFPQPIPSTSPTLFFSLSFLRLSNALEHPCKKRTLASGFTHVARATQECDFLTFYVYGLIAFNCFGFVEIGLVSDEKIWWLCLVQNAFFFVDFGTFCGKYGLF